ncbi:MAG: phosphoribosylglycinamide formyltransferase [Pseudomonadota bacterium]
MEGLRVGILISGSGSNMVSLVEAMLSGQIAAHPALVISNVADAKGLEKARALGVPAHAIPHTQFETRSAFEEALHTSLTEAEVDVLCCAGFMRILTAQFVAKWKGRMLNIHPSLLPKYPGLNTHARALEAGDRVHGCSVHLVTAELDAGPVLGQATVPVLEDDTPDSLAARVLEWEHRLYPATLARFVKGNNEPLIL